jgi:hypothetical protein
MMIETWDAVRRVTRPPLSEYGKFDTQRKREFLGDLALLLLERNLHRFNDDDLRDTYGKLAPRFGLPAEQARLVAREIESHTGLIVDSGIGYEFSHASLQEFLAGDAVYRHGEFDPAWLVRRNPVVAAVAIARSPDPGTLLAAVTHDPIGAPGPIPPRVLRSFLARLGLERPVFAASSIDIGRHLLLLVYRAKLSSPTAIRRLTEITHVRSSIRDAIQSMYHIDANPTRVDLRPRPSGPVGSFVPPLWFRPAVFDVLLPS